MEPTTDHTAPGPTREQVEQWWDATVPMWGPQWEHVGESIRLGVHHVAQRAYAAGQASAEVPDVNPARFREAFMKGVRYLQSYPGHVDSAEAVANVYYPDPRPPDVEREVTLGGVTFWTYRDNGETWIKAFTRDGALRVDRVKPDEVAALKRLAEGL